MDEKTITLYLFADEGVSSRGEKPILKLQKYLGSNGPPDKVIIMWHNYFGLEFSLQWVIFRSDDEEAQSKSWMIRSNGQSTFEFEDDSLQLISRMLNTNTFIARTSPHGENPITAYFDLRGLGAVKSQHPELTDWLPDER